MSEGTILIRCPGCGAAESVALAVGQQLQCHVCQTVFYAPVVETDQTSAAGSLPAPPTAAKPAGERSAQGGSSGQVRAPETRRDERSASSRVWRTEGLELGTGAKPDGAAEPQPSTRPAAATAPNLEVYPSGSTRVWTAITVLASLIIIIATSLVGLHFRRKWSQSNPPPRQAAQAGSRANAVDPAQIHWTDASVRAQRLGHVEVKILRAKYGAVRAKDLNNDVITTDDSNLLAINISVHNRGTRRCPFRSWYSGGLTAEDGGELVPELSDDAGHSYDLLRFDDVSSIEGQQLTDEIEPRHDVQDTVVFFIPTDTDRTAIRRFRLTLPAHAIGSDDFFRFEIPVSMIEDF